MRVSETEYLKIVTADKHEFFVPSTTAVLCPGFVALIEKATESEPGIAEARVPYGKSVIKVLIEYLYHKVRYLTLPDYDHVPPFQLGNSNTLQVFALALEFGM